MTAWQWEAAMVQVKEADLDAVAATLDERGKEVTGWDTKLDVAVGESHAPFARISSDQAAAKFSFDLHPTLATYRHEVPAKAAGPDPVRDHIETFAAPLLKLAAMHPRLKGRLTTSGVIYELRTKLRGGTRPNKGLALKRFTPPLRDRPWEQELGALRNELGRIDVRWGIDTKILGQKASLWFMVECTNNEAHSIIDTTCVLKSAGTEIPSSAWVVHVDEVHDVAWRTLVSFTRWMLSSRG